MGRIYFVSKDLVQDFTIQINLWYIQTMLKLIVRSCVVGAFLSAIQQDLLCGRSSGGKKCHMEKNCLLSEEVLQTEKHDGQLAQYNILLTESNSLSKPLSRKKKHIKGS